MNTLEIPFNGKRVEYAGSWEEIPYHHAPYIGKCLYWLESQQLTVDEFRKLVVDRLINRVNSAFIPHGQLSMNIWHNEALLADSVNFFFRVITEKMDDGQEVETWEVIPNFVKNLVPFVRIGHAKCYGPGDFLTGMSFGEFKDVSLCTQKWMETKEPEWLNRMMAISYRPRRLRIKKGRLSLERQPYSSEAVERRMEKVERVDMGYKYMYFQFLMGCLYMMRTNAQGQGIEIEGQRCNMSLIFNRQKEDAPPEDGIGLMGVLMALAETGVFGSIKKTARTDLWDVLLRLYQLELQARELDKKTKKNQ